MELPSSWKKNMPAPEPLRAAATDTYRARGLDILFSSSAMEFSYGPGVFGPAPELRRLDAIRASLLDPACDGPDPVYAIAMDVGRAPDRALLEECMLLFGIVVYARGQLGREPVRSQGHVHAISPHSGWSAPEIFEFWHGRAVVYCQQHTSDDPGRCLAINAGPGDVVVIPPGWAHYVVNADPREFMAFGAWCDREYGFVYDGVRARGGLAWFPIVSENLTLTWQPNPRYRQSKLIAQSPRRYEELGLLPGVPIYEQFLKDPETVRWVSHPERFQESWRGFSP
jgi:glucose-6-phosphate isomerase, archaeal